MTTLELIAACIGLLALVSIGGHLSTIASELRRLRVIAERRLALEERTRAVEDRILHPPIH